MTARNIYSIVILLAIITLKSMNVVQSLSISTGNGANNNNHKSNSQALNPRNVAANNLNNNQQVANFQQLQPPTTSPLFVPDNNYIDPLQQQQNFKQQDAAASTNGGQQQQDVLKAKSNYDLEHDDSVPLATINNHSRNNQASMKPPQYVDVSALVGRDRNLTGPFGNGTTSSGTSGISNTANILTPKSRSGLPECATQQVCNAIFVRMNYTQRLCECSSNYNWKCSHNLDPQDGHTIELTRKFDKRIYTQIKTCEPLREVRACKSPTDWTLLALQSERSGKAHYVVVCKCPTWAQLEGPYTHNHPPYANIPGIRVYGMLCAHQTARSSSAQSYSTYNPALGIYPEFPWNEAMNVLNTTNLASTLDLH